MINTFKKQTIALIVLGMIATYSYVAFAEPVVTESTSESTVSTTSKSDATVKSTVNSPPPSAISPSINATNSDLCVTGESGALQTQILGISKGVTIIDKNCERLKLAKTTYDMGMKVAAVSILCQDERVWHAMVMAGTPCPYEGKIGEEAKALWEANPEKIPGYVAEPVKKDWSNKSKK